MKNIIIDTDPGHDDALAIMLAVKSGMFNIRAVTTVAGNSTIENTTRNARYIMKLLGREDIPVYSGAEKPLERELVQAVVHGKSGLEGIEPQNDANLTGDAAEKIISIASDGGITLVTLGPLTNVAVAIKQNPEAMSKLEEIVMMGGAIKVPGNKSRAAEFNIFVDPEAADTVFRLPVKKTLVPLDACNHVKLHLKYFERISGKLREPVIAMMKPYIRNIMGDEGVKAALMYDPCTIYSLINPKACTKGECNIMVETKGELTRGMTVADLRKICEKPNMTVIERISEEEFRRDLVRILSI